MTITPVRWEVVAAPTVHDGDSPYLLRERELDDDGQELIIRRDKKPRLCRVLYLNTPELSGPLADPAQAKLAKVEAQEWFDSFYAGPGALEVLQYGYEKYGRPLVDIQVVGLDTYTFSQYMLTEGNNGKGWNPYTGGTR